MGWYQDNFPGSPAAKQRSAISRGVVIYTIVTGLAFYFFSPWSRRVRKELDEGNVFSEHPYFQQRRENLRLENRNLFASNPTAAQLLKAKEVHDKEKRGDFAGPDVSEEIIRSTY